MSYLPVMLECEEVETEIFRKAHQHPELGDPFEEDCAPMHNFTITFRGSSIGGGFTAKCLVCHASADLSKNVDY